jgi:hypothetical protein
VGKILLAKIKNSFVKIKNFREKKTREAKNAIFASRNARTRRFAAGSAKTEQPRVGARMDVLLLAKIKNSFAKIKNFREKKSPRSKKCDFCFAEREDAQACGRLCENRAAPRRRANGCFAARENLKNSQTNYHEGCSDEYK